jgi:hypothetical protein
VAYADPISGEHTVLAQRHEHGASGQANEPLRSIGLIRSPDHVCGFRLVYNQHIDVFWIDKVEAATGRGIADRHRTNQASYMQGPRGSMSVDLKLRDNGARTHLEDRSSDMLILDLQVCAWLDDDRVFAARRNEYVRQTGRSSDLAHPTLHWLCWMARPRRGQYAVTPRTGSQWGHGRLGATELPRCEALPTP